MKIYTRRTAIRSLSLGAAGCFLGTPLFANRHLSPNYSQVHSKNIPEEVLAAAQSFATVGIASISFTTAGGWLVMAKNGKYLHKSIPGLCITKLDEFISAGHQIQSVAFPPKGSNSFVIITNRGFAVNQIENALKQKLEQLKSAGTKIKHISFRPKRGNDRWIIVTEKGFVAQNITDECYQTLLNLQESPKGDGRPMRKLHHVNFSNTGGWVINSQDYFFGRHIPPACLAKMGELKRQNIQTDLVTFSGQGGWIIVSNSSFSEAPKDAIRAFERMVPGKGIRNRMKISKVPGLSIGVVINNKLAWSCAYGFLKTGGTHAVHSDSIFQAGSMSQLVSTIGALRMARLGKVSLDQDLREEKLGLDIPIKKGFEIMEGQEPTLALLLANRCGFGIPGLKGYSQGRALPSLADMLKGGGKANNRPVNIGFPPDTKYQPSSGGFIFMDKLIQKLENQPADKWLNENVLGPLGMKDSSFNVKIDDKYIKDHNVAAGHNPNGGMLTDERFNYPESSAYGLNTNVKDLANIIKLINQGGSYNGQTFLTTDLVEALLTPVNEKEKRTRGLGLSVTSFEDINQDGSNFRYTKAGQSVGFRSFIMGYPVQGTGVVVMSNGNAKHGPRFCYDVAKTVADIYGWE